VPRSMHRRHRSVASDPGSIARHPYIRFPMLSFIASLLFIDEATIHLLTQSPSESALFLGHSYSDEHPSDEHDICRTPHGVIKLLADSDDNRTLKAGLAVASDSDILPFNPFAFPSGLWSLVSGVWKNSGFAWRGKQNTTHRLN